QQLGVRQERMVAAESILRHAVHAAEVAAVSDRYPQVVQHPPARIGEQAIRRDARRRRGERHRARERDACIGERNDSSHRLWEMQPVILAEGDHEEYDRRAMPLGSYSKSMPPLRFPVAVIMQRTPLANRWVDERWEAIAVEVAEESAASTERVEDSGSSTRWRCAGHFVELHPVETEGYYLNV